jgi:hypothetical protein
VLQINGGAAGTRYLIVILPFLALPIGLALQSLPLTTVVLSAGSIAAMVGMTATRPAIAGDGDVLQRLTQSDGSSQTLADFIGATGWYDILPFYLAIAAALLFVALATPLSIARTEMWTAAAAVAGWGLITLAVPRLLTADYLDPNAFAVVVLAMVAVVVTVVAYAAVRQARGTERVALARSHAMPD